MSLFGFRTRTGEPLLALLVLVTALSSPAASAPKVYLDVTKEGGRKISLAVTPLAMKESSEESDLRAVLEKDLRVTGYFQLLPMESLQRDLFEIESESGTTQFPTWTDWGVELMLRTNFRRVAGGVIVEGRLFDSGKGRLLLGRKYRGKPGQEVRAAHSLANDVIKTVTGEPGIALTRIAFSLSEGGPKRITIMDYDGGRMRPVSPEGVLSLYPAWFPDGRRLAYVTYRHGRTEVVVHDLESGRIRSVAFFPGMNAFPAISGDGKSMLLTLSRDGNPEIYRVEVDGSSLKRLTFSKAVEASPGWSPDQKEIAFISDRTGSPQIYVSSVRGGRARRVSFTGRYSSSPDWSPKGGEIVFTSMVEGTFQIFTVDLESGENTQLTSGGDNKEDPSWAPNGRHVVFSEGRGSGYRLVLLDTRTGERFPLPRQGASHTSPSWSR
jgi:TolB protein